MFHTLLGNPSATSGTTVALTVENDARNFDLWAWIESELGGTETTYSVFKITIASGVIIGSNSTALTSFSTGSGWPSGATLTVTNNGTIVGAGGNGGGFGGNDGEDGGDGMIFTLDATLVNNGTIGGGGGGGGGATTGFGGGGGAGDRAGLGGYGDEPGGDGRLLTGGYGFGSAGFGGDLGEDGGNGNPGGTGGTAGNAIDKDGFTVGVTNNGTISGSVLA